MKPFALVLLATALFLGACQSPEPLSTEPLPEEPETIIVTSDHGFKCENFDYIESREFYDEWSSKLEAIYPDYEIYDLGSLCEAQVPQPLLSFAAWTEDDDSAIQQIVQFSEDGEILMATEPELIIRTAGDLSAPRIDKVEGTTATFTFYHGDGPCMNEDSFALDLNTFEYSLLESVRECSND